MKFYYLFTALVLCLNPISATAHDLSKLSFVNEQTEENVQYPVSEGPLYFNNVLEDSSEKDTDPATPVHEVIYKIEINPNNVAFISTKWDGGTKLHLLRFNAVTQTWQVGDVVYYDRPNNRVFNITRDNSIAVEKVYWPIFG